jgi:hypothetical protein
MKQSNKAYTDEFLEECLKKRKQGVKWNDMTQSLFDDGEKIRKACDQYLKRKANGAKTGSFAKFVKDEEEHCANGDINFTKKMFLSPDVSKDPDEILVALGYDPSKWSIVSWKISEWDVPSIKQDKACYSISGRIRPKTLTDMRDVDYFNAAKEFFATHRIESQTSAKPKFGQSPSRNQDFLIEIPAIELHLGKRAHITDAPENYDIKDAERCFNEIIDTIIRYAKDVHMTGNCLLVIGNDFFNAEFNNQTTNGTPQQNDGRYKKLFIKGMELYTTAIEKLIPVFDKIDVRLCQGNHAQSAEFYLYHSLSQYFRNAKNVGFSDNYRTTQAYVFGDCGIFFTHGDENEKRTIASIPAEFPEEWGKTKFRELHLGHLHKEGATITEMGGMITRRIPSPCAADDWHYNKRFIGNQRCHQFFVWSATNGLVAANYVNV